MADKFEIDNFLLSDLKFSQVFPSFSLRKLQKVGGKRNFHHFGGFMNILMINILMIVLVAFTDKHFRRSAPAIRGRNQLPLSYMKLFKDVESSTIAS